MIGAGALNLSAGVFMIELNSFSIETQKLNLSLEVICAPVDNELPDFPSSAPPVSPVSPVRDISVLLEPSLFVLM